VRSLRTVQVSEQVVHPAEGWQLQGSCRGPNARIFFPPNHFEKKEDKLVRERQAKAICGLCPVRRDCLSYALEIREQHGIWGGKTEIERRRLIDLEGASGRPSRIRAS
jgi:WhiB family redox-sensing transcriptional regulator